MMVMSERGRLRRIYMRLRMRAVVMLRGTSGVLVDGIETETEIEIELQTDDGRNQIGRVSGFEAARHWEQCD